MPQNEVNATYAAETIGDSEISIILTALHEAGIPETEVTRLIIAWGNTMLSDFIEHSYALQFGAPRSVGDYFRENMLSPEEHGALYAHRIAEECSALRKEKLREIQADIDENCQRLRKKLLALGCCEENIIWQVGLTRSRLLANLEKDIGRDLHLKRQEVSREIGQYERLPSLQIRFQQLADLWDMYNVLAQSGCNTRLIPVPYAAFMQDVFPSYTPTDQRPKLTYSLTSDKSKALDIIDWYFDPQLQTSLTGRNSLFNVPYHRTQYAQLAQKADMIGNYGLALIPESFATIQQPAMERVTEMNVSNCVSVDICTALSWALARISAIRRNETYVPNEDVKVVLPTLLHDSDSHEYRALLSLYQTNKNSPFPPRFGIAYNLVKASYVTDVSWSHPSLSCVGWNPLG